MKRLLLIIIPIIFLGSCYPPGEELEEVPPVALETNLYKENDENRIPDNTVNGMVLDSDGNPISGALVRVQTTQNFYYTNEQGEFSLNSVPLTSEVSITAWAEGYYINREIASSNQNEIEIELHQFSPVDNPNYQWLTSLITFGEGENQGCAVCHSSADTDFPQMLPVDEWLQDAHSQSVVNPRFLTTYNGTDVEGNQSPLTVFVPINQTRRNSGDYSYRALPPDSRLAYYGPGYKLDFPNSGGNCGNCHVPGAASQQNQNFTVDINKVTGIEKEGVFCDFCHKIWDIKLNPETYLPYPDQPGVMSYELRRPPEGQQFFAGPFDDVAPGEDTFSSIQKESRYCAGCHHGVFWDSVIYNSYGEWLDSPYSDPKSGQTCQDCHMPPSGAHYFVLPVKGGLKRDPEEIFTHLMPGAGDLELLQNSVTLRAQASNQEGAVHVRVEIINDKTGHHVPTGYPGRHLILLVEAKDRNKQLLKQIDGPVLPEWCGSGDPDEGNYAGLPGTAYAKVLQEDWTGYYPTVAYWNPNTIISDNRISAFATAASDYVFEKPSTGDLQIEVRLFLRRSFKAVMDWKSWSTPDILMEKEIIHLQ